MGRNYSANPDDYKFLEEVGYGASATVYRAIYLPVNEVVAVKCLDLDRCNSNLDDIRREAQTMSLINHPNVIKAFCSFVVDHNLWVVMPFMAEGSCLHLMKIAYPEGFEESAIGSVLKETLKALEYLHRHGHIHRDVKAGNILMDSDGEVKLADFGVSACMFDRGDRQRSRNTFVGTPCWMAPEVLQPGAGYDFKADIWSFGITALELAHGHAPFSKYPPMKVLLMTIQNAPPGLDYDREKDQTKRPTAEKLLKHSFFKNAKPPELSVKKLFADLPPLWKRVKDLQLKDAAQLALKRMPSAEQEAISQSEYQRGVSAWNFDIEDLKLQASLLHEEDEIQEIKEEEDGIKFYMSQKSSTFLNKFMLCLLPREKANGNEVLVAESQTKKEKVYESDLTASDNQGKNGLKKSASKAELLPPMVEKDAAQAKTKNQTGRPRQTQSGPLMPGTVLSHSLSERTRKLERCEIDDNQVAEKAQQVRRAPSFSGPLNLPNRASANSLSAPIKSSGGFKDSLEDKSKTNLVQIKGRFSVTSENVDLVKDIPLSTVSRRNSQGSPLRKSASVGNWIFDSKQMSYSSWFQPHSQPPKEFGNSNVPASILMPHLQNLFQQTSIQQDLIMNLLSSLQTVELENAPQNGKLPPLPRDLAFYEKSFPMNLWLEILFVIPYYLMLDYNCGLDRAFRFYYVQSSAQKLPSFGVSCVVCIHDFEILIMLMLAELIVSERERMLLMKISELQARMNSLTDELTAEKLKYMQLQQRLNAVSAREEDGDRREGDS
ncbi:UNVERIFIED_CONTAM: Serine/threonine-protein kinase fray2 [Sesamum calycinum]|uniref:Serine/threonine-protein kinase fray2 n=1 Tax=Sesamum calycinum TaxID=2727403 RepID=A0AAW2QZ35_9LAMI